MIEDQPPPLPSSGDMWWDVMDDMRERRVLGITRYGTPLQAFNGREALIDAYQEELDKIVYLRQAVEEMRVLRQLVCDMLPEYHSANNSIRDHVDRTAKGWTVGDIRTCDDPICVIAVELGFADEVWPQGGSAMAKSDLDKQVEQSKKDMAKVAEAQAVNSGQTYEPVDEVPISQDEQRKAEILSGTNVSDATKTTGGA